MRLEEQVAARDAAVFVARERELGLLAGLLGDGPHRLAFVTGPAGVGKSALLREVGRRAASYDGLVVLLDDPSLDGPDLRERVAGLPGDARIVVASRRPPDAGWWRSGWASSLLVVHLDPLGTGAAGALLTAHGITEPAEVDALVAWSDGFPLALSLAAAARQSADAALGPADLAALEETLLDHLTEGRLTGADLVGADRLVLAVAALAPAVEAELLEATLPGGAGAAAERWLRGLPFTERRGHRVALDPRVRRLLAAGLRRLDPDLERALRLRIIDHLADAAQAGRPQLVTDMRAVLGPRADQGSIRWYVDTARPADVPLVRSLLAADDPAYAAWVCRWIEDLPQQVLVVRHPHPAEDEPALAALALWATPADLRADPGLAAWRSRVEDWGPGTLLNPVTEVFVAEPEASALLLDALVQRCGLPNPRRWVAPRKGTAPDPAGCGGVAEPGLDLRFGTTLVEAWVIDYGPGGVIPALLAQAHAELAPPAAVAASMAVGVGVLRDALRAFHDPLLLATSPLATGADPASRAASVVRQVRAAIDGAFGAGPDAQLQREVLLRGYVDADASHARAMRSLHLSRTTYFRRLREATATVAAWLDASSVGGPH